MTDIGEPCPNGLYECAKDNLGEFHTVTFASPTQQPPWPYIEMYPAHGDGGLYKLESSGHGEQLVIDVYKYLYQVFQDAVESTVEDLNRQNDEEWYIIYKVGDGAEAEFHTDARVERIE